MILRAPGMLALHVALDRVEDAVHGRRSGTTRVAAYDMGALCAQWFSDFLGRPLRLVRFDPEQRRLADRALDRRARGRERVPGRLPAAGRLDRVARRGEPAPRAAPASRAVTMARFRPNLVLDGLDAHGEDHLDEIVFDTADGPVRLKLVKPCGRCSIPDVDPRDRRARPRGRRRARPATAPTARLDGALTFGMNAVIVEGIDRSAARRHAAAGRAIAFD